MKCIVVEKGKMTSKQYDNVTALSYNSSTHVCTITYGSGTSVNYNTDNYSVYITSN